MVNTNARQLPLDSLRAEQVYESIGRQPSALYSILHSVVNAIGAVLGIVCVLLPILPFVVVATLIDSPGPIFYRQRRVGKGGKEFSVIKFRTMRTDAETGGAVWAQVNDTRVTKVGKVLRTYRIDEVPQFLNMLMGDMALIGPRPERPEFVSELKQNIPFYDERHVVKPGITGWAQVNYKYGNSDKDAFEKLKYDLYWIANRSIMLDFRIVLQSVRVVLTGFGSH